VAERPEGLTESRFERFGLAEINGGSAHRLARPCAEEARGALSEKREAKTRHSDKKDFAGKLHN